jgi:prevent-host-death family protein
MEISAKELRIQPGKIIAKVLRGIDVVITYRGKRLVRMVPVTKNENIMVDGTDEIFGLWKSHSAKQSVEEEVRSIRKGRSF